MKHEEKVAVVTGVTTGLVAAGIAAMLGTPFALVAAAMGTYKVTKGAYDRAKFNSKS